jgi:hypothetical protein
MTLLLPFELLLPAVNRLANLLSACQLTCIEPSVLYGAKGNTVELSVKITLYSLVSHIPICFMDPCDLVKRNNYKTK